MLRIFFIILFCTILTNVSVAQHSDTVVLPSLEANVSVMELQQRQFIKHRLSIGAGFTNFYRFKIMHGNNIYGVYSYSFTSKLYGVTQFYIGFANEKYRITSFSNVMIKSKLREYILGIGAGYRPLYIRRHMIATEFMIGAGYSRYRSYDFTYGSSFNTTSSLYHYTRYSVMVSLLAGYYYQVTPRNEFGIEWRSLYLCSGWSGGVSFRYTYLF